MKDLLKNNYRVQEAFNQILEPTVAGTVLELDLTRNKITVVPFTEQLV